MLTICLAHGIHLLQPIHEKLTFNFILSISYIIIIIIIIIIITILHVWHSIPIASINWSILNFAHPY